MHHGSTHVRAALSALALTLLVVVPGGSALDPSDASAEQAGSKIHRRASGFLAAGARFSCARLDTGRVRCWGIGFYGALGYGNTNDIGDNETPASAGPVDLGAGRTARAITGGGSHTCAILDNGKVRCWGLGSRGQLGYGDRRAIGDDEVPASVRPVRLGARRKAIAISAYGQHTCAVLNNRTVRCWGTGRYGQPGYANTRNIGDNEHPGSVGPVKLGRGRKAVAIQAGGRHTFALLDYGRLRSWGLGSSGQLGYANSRNIGNDETPASAGPISLGGDVATG